MAIAHRSNRLGLFLAILLVVLLALPTLRWAALGVPDGGLYGYADEIPARPAVGLRSIKDRTLQRWIEKYADVNHGFRMVLIRTFNEINFRLFGEAPKLQLYSTSLHGLYSRMALDSLNDQTVNRSERLLAYRAEAIKLLSIQKMLASHGKVFMVVIAASKPYVYPEGLGARFVKTSDEADPFAQVASFGDVLKAEGVSVLDGDRSLRDFAKRTNIQTHANSGVHWNYYAGCLVASQIVDVTRQTMPDRLSRLECGPPVNALPHMIDLDGWSLLNLWSAAGLQAETPYPSFPEGPVAAAAPRFLIVNDSFVDQIVYSLRAAGSYSRLVTSRYFKVRSVDDRLQPGASSTTSVPEENDAKVRALVFDDLVRSDVVILEMVDYNVGRMGYGFPEYLLEHSNELSRIDHSSGVGGYDLETDGENSWNWVANNIRFDLVPSVDSTRPTRTRVRFQYATRGAQSLSGTLTSRDGEQRRFAIPVVAENRLGTFDEVLDIPAAGLVRLELSSDGTPSTLGPNDPRKVSWMVRNLDLQPITDQRR